MKTAITLSCVAEASAGPFVFQGSLEQGFADAKRTGFDQVELFLPGPQFVASHEIRGLIDKYEMGISAVGTGAGMILHGYSLTDADPEKRKAALTYLTAMVNFAGSLGAPAILGSMQGRWNEEIGRDQALHWLGDALQSAGEVAANHGVRFLYEPLNRYESNLINRLAEAAQWIEDRSLENIVLLADLFHMNIEEIQIADAIRTASHHVGHVHYADSNRLAMGFGHTDPAPIIKALIDIGYDGCLSAEIFPLPDAETAAHQTLQSIRSFMS